MKINIICSCPEYFGSNLTSSILGRAAREGLVTWQILSLRDFADGHRKKQVDDSPYGGGPGMILKIEPIVRALEFLKSQGDKAPVYLTSAKGPHFTQTVAREWSTLPAITFICGHYEGVDERVLHFVDGQISLGDFVLTGGEPAVAVIADAVVRLLPGVLGNSDSLTQESFTGHTLEYPQYTRPEDFRGLRVPDILLSGNHGEIARWRERMSTPLG